MISVLIGLAVSLITAAQQPNVPTTYKLEALTLASQILTLAQETPQDAPTTQTITEATTTPTGAISTSTTIVFVPAPEPPLQQVQQMAAAVPILPTCTFGATLVHWQQGTDHALFTWTFTDGASAEIDANGQKVDLLNGPSQLGSIRASDSSHQQDVYGPSVFASTTYSLVVGNDAGTTTCEASI